MLIIYSPKNYNEYIENQCIDIVEKQIDNHFDILEKKLYENIFHYIDNSFSYERTEVNLSILETMIRETFLNVNEEIKNEIKDYGVELNNINMPQIQNEINKIFKYIEEFKETQYITKNCEKIINKFIKNSFEYTIRNDFLNIAAERLDIADIILCDNSIKKIKKYNKEEAAKILEGFLLNLKLYLRNSLTDEIIKAVNDNNIEDEDCLIA